MALNTFAGINFLYYHRKLSPIFCCNYFRVGASLEPGKCKNGIIASLQAMVTKKRVEVNTIVIMSNHIHIIWQIKEGYERDIVQRDFGAMALN